MTLQIPKVDPSLLKQCADAISAVHEHDHVAFDENFADVMSATVMFQVGGDQALALAITVRIAKLVGCIGDDPRIVELFGEKNSTAIPAPLAKAAAVAPLRENGTFNPTIIRRTALRFVEARGHA